RSDLIGGILSACGKIRGFIFQGRTDSMSMVTDRAGVLDAAAQSRIIAQLVQELGARATQIDAAVELLDGGATVPFIARYRKEVTGGLDDTVLRNLELRLEYLRDME